MFSARMCLRRQDLNELMLYRFLSLLSLVAIAAPGAASQDSLGKYNTIQPDRPSSASNSHYYAAKQTDYSHENSQEEEKIPLHVSNTEQPAQCTFKRGGMLSGGVEQVASPLITIQRLLHRNYPPEQPTLLTFIKPKQNSVFQLQHSKPGVYLTGKISNSERQLTAGIEHNDLKEGFTLSRPTLRASLAVHHMLGNNQEIPDPPASNPPYTPSVPEQNLNRIVPVNIVLPRETRETPYSYIDMHRRTGAPAKNVPSVAAQSLAPSSTLVRPIIATKQVEVQLSRTRDTIKRFESGAGSSATKIGTTVIHPDSELNAEIVASRKWQLELEPTRDKQNSQRIWQNSLQASCDHLRPVMPARAQLELVRPEIAKMAISNQHLQLAGNQRSANRVSAQLLSQPRRSIVVAGAMAKIESGTLRKRISWDKWYAEVANSAEHQLSAVLNRYGNPSGSNTLEITVTPQRHLTLKVLHGTSDKFDAATTEAFMALNGHASLDFPSGSKRHVVTFLVDNTHRYGEAMAGILSRPATGDDEPGP